MAQINLTVVAESAEELQSILLDLAGIVEATGGDVVTASGEGAVTTEPTRRGKGRPKGSKNKTGEAPPVDPAEARAALEKIQEERQTPPAPAPAVTVAPLPPTEPAPAPAVAPPAEAPKGPSLDDTRLALKALVDAKGRDAAMKVLNDAKFEKLSDVPPQCYGEIIAAAQAALA